MWFLCWFAFFNFHFRYFFNTTSKSFAAYGRFHPYFFFSSSCNQVYSNRSKATKARLWTVKNAFNISVLKFKRKIFVSISNYLDKEFNYPPWPNSVLLEHSNPPPLFRFFFKVSAGLSFFILFICMLILG